MTESTITRAEAQLQGLKRYFTGKPCKRDHISERNTNNKLCRECERLAARERYKSRHPFPNLLELKRIDAPHIKVRPSHNAQDANGSTDRKEYQRLYQKKYRRLRMGKVKEISRRSYLKQTDEIRASKKLYRAKNLEKIRTRFRKWVKNNRHVMRVHAHRRRARLKNVDGKHTAADIKTLIKLQRCKCMNCKKDLAAGYHVDHIMPIALGGSNDRKNLQILCPFCNISKSAKHPIDWAQEHGRLL